MAVEIAKVECVEVGDNGKYGRFVVEPLLFTSKVCSMNFPPFPA